MEKTLLRKITKSSNHPNHHYCFSYDPMIFHEEAKIDRKIITGISEDLLQPRTEAVARLLQMCKNL